jgi:perosamine synthetase
MIPITSVQVGQQEEALVLEVLRSGLLAQGPIVQRLEQLCCEMAGSRHAVAVSNGTVALVLALQALDLGSGDEVVTSPYTFVATLNAILEAGATARFADISLVDFNVDPGHMAAKVTPRTKVLMPVHLYGQAAEALARDRGLVVVEDAAQAHGARIDGRPVGSAGLATFSFYATKNLFCGEGGVITTDDDALADRMRVLRNQGMRARYEYEEAGHNYRLTDLAAAVVVPQFERLTAVIEARRANAAFLSERLGDVPGLTLPATMAGRNHVWHQYTVRVGSEARIHRDTLSKELSERGIGNGVYYPRPVYDYGCYREHPQVIIEPCPNAERAGREVLSLPVHQHLGRDDLHRIVDVMHELLM